MSIYLKEEAWVGTGSTGYVLLYPYNGTPQTLRTVTETSQPGGILGQDYYESGSWTPKIWDTSFADGDCTYSVQYGFYQRYSVFVYIIVRVELSSISFASDIYLGNLPYTCSSTYKGVFQVKYASVNSVNANPPISCVPLFSDTKGYFQEWDASTGTTSLAFGDLTSGTDFYITGWYAV